MSAEAIRKTSDGRSGRSAHPSQLLRSSNGGKGRCPPLHRAFRLAQFIFIHLNLDFVLVQVLFYLILERQRLLLLFIHLCHIYACEFELNPWPSGCPLHFCHIAVASGHKSSTVCPPLSPWKIFTHSLHHSFGRQTRPHILYDVNCRSQSKNP
jgi:hypothetical protein